MACIKFDNNLRNHPKTYKLMDLLKADKAKALGHLTLLWCWCVDHAEDGVLRKINDPQIAFAAEWTGDAKMFVNAFVESGFLERGDGVLTIHDWEDWKPEFVRRRDRRLTGQRSDIDRTLTDTEQEERDSSAVVLSFPTAGTAKDNGWLLTEKKLQELSPLYPGVDVLLECKKALEWLKMNPGRRKTDRGMGRFLMGWLERSQNRSRGFGNAQTFDADLGKRREIDARVDAIIGGRRPIPRT